MIPSFSNLFSLSRDRSCSEPESEPELTVELDSVITHLQDESASLILCLTVGLLHKCLCLQQKGLTWTCSRITHVSVHFLDEDHRRVINSHALLSRLPHESLHELLNAIRSLVDETHVGPVAQRSAVHELGRLRESPVGLKIIILSIVRI